MICSSSSVITILASTGPSEDPIDTPSSCLYSLLLKEKIVLRQESRISFFKDLLDKVVEITCLLNTLSIITSTVKSNGTQVNKETTSNETNL